MMQFMTYDLVKIVFGTRQRHVVTIIVNISLSLDPLERFNYMLQKFLLKVWKANNFNGSLSFSIHASMTLDEDEHDKHRVCVCICESRGKLCRYVLCIFQFSCKIFSLYSSLIIDAEEKLFHVNDEMSKHEIYFSSIG